MASRPSPQSPVPSPENRVTNRNGVGFGDLNSLSGAERMSTTLESAILRQINLLRARSRARRTLAGYE